MKQVADAVVLSQSAATRLEDRGLPARYLCPTDRRGIYTDVTEAGLKLLAQARPTNDAALWEALAEAAANPELSLLVAAVEAVETAGVVEVMGAPSGRPQARVRRPVVRQCRLSPAPPMRPHIARVCI